MNKPTFKNVPGTHKDEVDITLNDTTIRIRNWAIVEHAVSFLCECGPEARAEIIKELANPNQWAVPLIQQPIPPCPYAPCLSSLAVAEQK